MSKMTKAEKIDKIVEGLEEKTDFEIMKQMKEILNKVMGESNNQILKPNYHTIKRIAYEEGNLSGFLAMAKDCEIKELEDYIRVYLSEGLFYQILIKFPEVKITNGSDEHLIKDLYVRVLLRPNGTLVPHLSGIRGKLSIHEVRSGYAHSHLPYINPRDFTFDQFCTGIGPINQVLMLLSNKFTEINFKMFLFHLKVFVAWESKEGRPHMYMENISKTNHRQEYHLNTGIAENVGKVLLGEVKKLSPEAALPLLDYDILPTKVTVKINDAFEKWAAGVIRSWDLNTLFRGYGLEMDCLMNTKDNMGRYYTIPRRDVPPDLYDSEKVLFQFKGEDIKLQVELPQIIDAETIKDEEKIPHQLITKYVSEKLSSGLSKSAFGNARIRLCSAGVY